MNLKDEILHKACQYYKALIYMNTKNGIFSDSMILFFLLITTAIYYLLILKKIIYNLI